MFNKLSEKDQVELIERESGTVHHGVTFSFYEVQILWRVITNIRSSWKVSCFLPILKIEEPVNFESTRIVIN